MWGLAKCLSMAPKEFLLESHPLWSLGTGTLQPSRGKLHATKKEVPFAHLLASVAGGEGPALSDMHIPVGQSSHPLQLIRIHLTPIFKAETMPDHLEATSWWSVEIEMFHIIQQVQPGSGPDSTLLHNHSHTSVYSGSKLDFQGSLA